MSLLIPWLRPSDKKDSKVTTRTTNGPKWWRGESCVTTNVATAHNTWWPKWQPKYNPDNPDDNRWLPWTINVTNCWQPWKFLDDIWRLHLVIFIAKVESCLPCSTSVIVQDVLDKNNSWESMYWIHTSHFLMIYEFKALSKGQLNVNLFQYWLNY